MARGAAAHREVVSSIQHARVDGLTSVPHVKNSDRAGLSHDDLGHGDLAEVARRMVAAAEVLVHTIGQF